MDHDWVWQGIWRRASVISGIVWVDFGDQEVWGATPGLGHHRDAPTLKRNLSVDAVTIPWGEHFIQSTVTLQHRLFSNAGIFFNTSLERGWVSKLRELEFFPWVLGFFLEFWVFPLSFRKILPWELFFAWFFEKNPLTFQINIKIFPFLNKNC